MAWGQKRVFLDVKYDVVLSAWNGMWANHLAHGLSAYQISSCIFGCPDSEGELVSAKDAFLSRMAISHAGRFPEPVHTWLKRFSITLFEKEAASHVEDGNIFWGWGGMNLTGLEKAKLNNRIAVVESGSTHAHWSRAILRKEYAKHGFDYDKTLNSELIPKCIKEYEIADYISVPSQFVARTFTENGIPGEKLRVNAFGVDHSFWNESAVNRGTIARPFRFIYAGHLMLRKGLAYLLEAWRSLAAKDAELWLVGGPHVTGNHFIRCLPPRATYLGAKNHKQLRDLYAQADVYLLPSLEEGLARSVLEAMAAGLAVVITEETGAADIMVDTEDGWVIPSCSVDALVEKMIFCLKNPALIAQCGASGSRRVVPFSWAEYGRRAGGFAKTLLQGDVR